MSARRTELPVLEPGLGTLTAAVAPKTGRHLEAAVRRSLRPLWITAVLVPLLAFAGGAWWVWQQTEAQTRARLVRTVEMLHAQAQRAFETQDALLTAVQMRSAGMSWEEIAASRELDAFLRALVESGAGSRPSAWTGPDGRPVQIPPAPSPPAVAANFSDRDFVRAHRGAIVNGKARFVGETIAGRVGGRVVVPLSRPRLGPDGMPDGGVIWATFQSADFARFFASIIETPRDTVMLLRTDGSVLARHPQPDPPVGQRVPPDAAAMLAAADSAAHGRVGFATGASSFEPETGRIFAARQLEGQPVAVVYGLHTAGPRADWLRQVVVLGAVTTVAALLLLWMTRVAGARAWREATALDTARQEAELRLEAEARLRHAERVGALGRVAAGVAHDMNNLVQSVLSAARLIARRADDPAEVRRIAGMISEVGARGQRIARRMLGFSRATPAAGDGPLDLAASFEGLEELLGGLLGSGIRISCTAEPGLSHAMVDRGEFETVLVNLAVNARDALPDGGEVRISATADEFPPHPVGRDRRWLRVTVADTGQGMSPEVLARAGEPFFTTKGEGRGTGLGLAMARQFAERAGGMMRIESAPGKGTTVTLWLPAAATTPATAP